MQTYLRGSPVNVLALVQSLYPALYMPLQTRMNLLLSVSTVKRPLLGTIE